MMLFLKATALMLTSIPPLHLAAFFALGFVAWLWIFFWFYMGAMATIRAYNDKKLNGYHYPLCVPFMLIALLYDVISNICIVSFIFLEWPRQLTATARFKRHHKKEGWRGEISRFMCRKILSPFDPTGDHCD